MGECIKRVTGIFLAAALILTSVPARSMAAELEENSVPVEAAGAELSGEDREEPAEEEPPEEEPPEEEPEAPAETGEGVSEETDPPVTPPDIVASGTCGETLNWTLDSSGTLVISGTGEIPCHFYESIRGDWEASVSLENIVIEEGITAIGAYAFSDCLLTGVRIPASVTDIGEQAFYSCSKLVSLDIPRKVASIGSNAFAHCSNLTEVTIREGVTSIGNYMFCACSNLTSVSIPESVTSIGHRAFLSCFSLPSVTIPKNVTSIGEEAFSGCSALTVVNIPEGVASIAGSTFSGCSALLGVGIPEGVQSIGSSAFYGCSALTGVRIPASVTSIGEWAFSGCSALTAIDVSEGNTVYASEDGILFSRDKTVLYVCPGGWKGSQPYGIPASVTSIYSDAFSGCGGLTGVTIPESVASIGMRAFRSCSALTELTIPGSVKSIDIGVFSGCSALTSVTIPEGVQSIDLGAFSDCSALTELTIPGSVTSIGKEAFSGCSALTGVTIPGSVTSIGKEAFFGCSALTDVTIQEGITSIGEEMFRGCSALTELTIPEGVESIGAGAFLGCSALSHVVIPASVTRIGTSIETGTEPTIFGEDPPLKTAGPVGTVCDIEFGWRREIPDHAFYGSTKLTSAILPRTLMKIGDGAFMGCSALTGVIFPEDGISSIGMSAFSGCAALTGIAIPACGSNISPKITEIPGGAFANCTSLTSVSIPDHISGVAENAFKGCTALREIYYAGSKEQWEQVEVSDGNIPLKNAVIHDSTTAYPVYLDKRYGAPLETVIVPKGLMEKPEDPTMPNLVLDGWYRDADYKAAWDFETDTVTGPMTLYAKWAIDPSVHSGTCGEGLTWKLNGIGTLTISGTGKMSISPQNPWQPYKGLIKRVVVEEGVTSIGYTAFSNCGELTAVTLPESVAAIEANAFSGCGKLSEITLPAGLTSIGDRAFDGCASLTAIALPAGLTEMGESVFSGCDRLTDISIAPENPRFCVVDGVLFNQSRTELHYCLKSGTEAYTVPDGVERIGNYAFTGCGYLTAVTIPGSVQRIREYAFRGCSALRTVNYAGSQEQWRQISSVPADQLTGVEFYFGAYTVTFDARNDETPETAAVAAGGKVPRPRDPVRAGWLFGGWFKDEACTAAWNFDSDPVTETTTLYAKWDVDPEAASGTCGEHLTWSLGKADGILTISGSGEMTEAPWQTSSEQITDQIKGIAIGPNVTSICAGAFCFCKNLTGVTIPESVASIGDGAFDSCTGLTGVTIQGDASIGKTAFWGCTSLTELKLQGVTSIGESAFLGCTALTDLKLQGPISSIGEGAFGDCTGLSSVTFQASDASEICGGAFNGCSALKHVTIQGGAVNIGDGAFAGLTGLTDVTVQGSISDIGRSAFSGCIALTGVAIQSAAAGAAIGENAFDGCTGLTSVTLPQGIVSIGQYAFGGCGNLTGVTLPQGLASIGNDAFQGCTGLTEITIPGSVAVLGEGAFFGCTGLTGVAIQKGVTSIGCSVFDRCTNLTSVTIPESVTSIGYNAFCDCASLTDITIPESVTWIEGDAFIGAKLTRVVIPGLRTRFAEATFLDFTGLHIYGYSGSFAEAYTINYDSIPFEYLPDDTFPVSTRLTTNVPGGLAPGSDFVIQAGYTTQRAVLELRVNLPGGITVSSVYLDGTELLRGSYSDGYPGSSYTLSNGTLTVSLDGLPGKLNRTLQLYCTAAAGSHSISGTMTFRSGGTAALGTAVIRAEQARLEVPETVSRRDGILASGKTLPNGNVTLYIDGRRTGYSAAANEAGSWKLQFDLPADAAIGSTHQIFAVTGTDELRTDERTVTYQPSSVARPVKITMYNTGDRGLQETEFHLFRAAEANLVRYYRVWPDRYPAFTFQVEFGEGQRPAGVTIITRGSAQTERKIPAAYDADSGCWAGTSRFETFQDAPAWVGVIYSDEDGNLFRSNLLSATAIMDPSGYVYEAVPSNRLSGVTATIWEGSQAEAWNAGDYDQVNPQITGADGSYYWDVPSGSWQVRFEKAGYESTQTDWLTVPPPRVGINAAMVSTAAPEVRYAAVYEGCAEITFSQYMNIDSVRRAVTLNGGSAAVEALDAEYAADGLTMYATRFRAAAGGLSGEVILAVSTGAVNYAGKALKEKYEKGFSVEARPTGITAPEMTGMKVSDTVEIPVVLMPEVSGRVLTVENLTPAIVQVGESSVTTGEGGAAGIPVKALLPGTGLLRVSDPASGLEATASVRVRTGTTCIEASIDNGILTYSVQAPEGVDAKLLLACCHAQRMSQVILLDGKEGRWTLPDPSGSSCTLFLVESGSWKPLCSKQLVL